MQHKDYELVVGLEIHAELLTHTKVFCTCPLTPAVVDPNMLICPVCIGLPGAMPVLSQEAVDMVILVALALNCQVNEFSMFARKSYYYPDLPKGFQITQYDFPLATNGWLEVQDSDNTLKKVGIQQAHLEEDTAKLLHQGDHTLIDFNRSGVPLVEIVSKPEIHSVEAVYDYATKVRQILRYLGVNSGEMEKGVIRFEANVSVRPRGSRELGTRVEVKNLNSFRALVQSVEYEFHRHVEILESGNQLVQETRGWDERLQATVSQRKKESAVDYRYFPEPDLPPLLITQDKIQKIQVGLPELPSARCKRFLDEYELPPSDARLLVSEKILADYFETAIKQYNGSPRSVAIWVKDELLHLCKKNKLNISVSGIPVPPQHLVSLIHLVDRRLINNTIAKSVLEEMFSTGSEPLAIIKKEGLEQISDEEHILGLTRRVIESNPSQLATYLAGKETVFEWFVGQVMGLAQGKADPQIVRQHLRIVLESISLENEVNTDGSSTAR